MTWRRPAAAFALGLAALLAALLAACGLSTNDEPEAIPALGDADTTTEPSTVALPGAAVDNIPVFFLTSTDAGTSLISARRQVALPATPGSWMEALFLQPPSRAERREGIWTAIPVGTKLASTPEQRGHVLTVDLPAHVYDELNGVGAQYAFAQIVWTATSINGVDKVTFLRDGAKFEAVDGRGRARDRPLGRTDFPDFAYADVQEGGSETTATTH